VTPKIYLGRSRIFFYLKGNYHEKFLLQIVFEFIIKVVSVYKYMRQTFH